jgi:uncharacterized protein YaiE (UPF0345 family)
MNCIYCYRSIPDERLEFLIENNRPKTCINCSTEQRAVGFMDWEHKTAPQLVLVPANAKESIRILNRANRRSR